MIARGRVQNGVVVLDANVQLPEGALVRVETESAVPPMQPLSDLHRLERLRIIDRVASLPIEGATEPFNGSDHDQVLYGNPS